MALQIVVKSSLNKLIQICHKRGSLGSNCQVYRRFQKLLRGFKAISVNKK